MPNSAGQFKHQLWYKECLVKETVFDTCEPAPAATPQSKTSHASSSSLNFATLSVIAVLCSLFTTTPRMRFSMVAVCVLAVLLSNGVHAQTSTCENVGVGQTDIPLNLYFGKTEGGNAVCRKKIAFEISLPIIFIPFCSLGTTHE
jgi:hypothetical protein